ncbi:LamB/YcsF family protein [Salibacterium lacus]|uniref:5-oxoprolinase subunit A n=1 Tax=Salibacterium lacus TaxID=1898109 RepID=A0ABW5T5C3_9BACI
MVDLNSDVGESFGAYTLGNDDEVLSYVTSANIACGYHAGDHNVMARTTALAKQHGAAVGAHPGFPDLGGFGRRSMAVDPEEIYQMIVYQIGALQGFCETENIILRHVKPHGALYNQAAGDPDTAEAVVEAVRGINPGLILFAPAGSKLVEAAREKSLRVASEVFADRTYQPDGSLTPRSQADAVLHDPGQAADRILHMLSSGEVEAVDGTRLPVEADTICVHGDTPEALPFLDRLYHMLRQREITLQIPGGSL